MSLQMIMPLLPMFCSALSSSFACCVNLLRATWEKTRSTGYRTDSQWAWSTARH